MDMSGSGADVTIIGAYVFQRVAAVDKLKKGDFKSPPSYSQLQSKAIQICMYLDIFFGEDHDDTSLHHDTRGAVCACLKCLPSVCAFCNL